MKVIILDYAVQKVYTLDYNPIADEDLEDYLESKGINTNNCEWMSVEELIIEEI